MSKLTKAQRALLGDVVRHASIKSGGWYLRDMRRNQAGIELERLGLVTRDYPEPTGWPGKNRILMKITDAGRAALQNKDESNDA